MENNVAQNCWDYWNCKIKLDCAAYQTDSGRECYEVASHFCPRVNSDKSWAPKVERGFKYCWECPWFKIIQPDFKKKFDHVE